MNFYKSFLGLVVIILFGVNLENLKKISNIKLLVVIVFLYWGFEGGDKVGFIFYRW